MVFMDLLESTVWLISPKQFLYVRSLPESVLRASFNQTADDREQVLQNPKAFRMLSGWRAGKFTAHRPLPFSEPLTQSFGFNLIRLAAESMPKFVADGEVQKLVKGNMPLVQQLKLSLRIGHKQGFFNECLTPFKDTESWAIGIHLNSSEDWFPILRSN
jgi:hypothetical protein